MFCRVVWEDERRTLNIEHPTSNEKQNPLLSVLSAAISVSLSFSIQYSMLNVRCLMFILFSQSWKKTT